MLRILTDEESVAHADEQIQSVSYALAATVRKHPGTSIEALTQVLYMVNGQSWIAHTDFARAREAARRLLAPPADAP
jgi:hypothetical protein